FTACGGNFIVFLVYTQMMKDVPWYHLFRTGNVIGLMIMPLSFFYFRSILKPKVFKAFDLVHFIPALLYTIDYLPVFLLPGPEKIAMATREMQMPDRGQSLQNGWITPSINWVIVRTLLMTTYWVLQIRMLYCTSRIRQFNVLLKENRAIIRWFVITCVLQAFYFLPFYLNFFIGASPYNFIIIHTSISAGVFVQIVLLFFSPEILYGLRGLIISYPDSSRHIKRENAADIGEERTSTSLTGNAAKDQTPGQDFLASKDITSNNDIHQETSHIPKLLEYLSEEKIKEIALKIDEVLVEDHAYLQKGYSMRDLSIATGYQPYLLSAVIHQEHKQHFNDFINFQRVRHACILIKSGAGKLLTLQALAEESGFNNRNSFTTAFKKHMGQTPDT
ncbi:MAG TPA: helix-turn-helix domain-containing protein, partial [Agriterribacter sp.]